MHKYISLINYAERDKDGEDEAEGDVEFQIEENSC